MKGYFKENYEKKDGKTVFVYIISGTTEQILDYKNWLGKEYTEENSKPLFQTLFYYGKEIDIKNGSEKGFFSVTNDLFDESHSKLQGRGENMFKDLYEQSKDENWLKSDHNMDLIKNT